MDSNLPRTASVKQLGELLQEQQEPFTLENFLQERGYAKKSLSPNNTLKRSASCDLKRRRKVIPQCCKIVKAAFQKLLSINGKLRIKNAELRERNQEIDEAVGWFSSASSTTVFNSCPETESDTDERMNSTRRDYVSSATGNLEELSKQREQLNSIQATNDRKHQWRCTEDTKQLSPVSVLEEIPSNEASPVHKTNNTERTPHLIVTDDTVLSACLWDSQELCAINPSSQHQRSKRVLRQTKQLLFDCVREVVETNYSNDKKRKHSQEFLGSEEIGKLICDRISRWERQYGDEANITGLINVGFLDSAEEWKDFKPQAMVIGVQIGDAIFEEVRNEIVTELSDRN